MHFVAEVLLCKHKPSGDYSNWPKPIDTQVGQLPSKGLVDKGTRGETLALVILTLTSNMPISPISLVRSSLDREMRVEYIPGLLAVSPPSSPAVWV